MSKKTAVRSITMLPSDWCDILTANYDFICTIQTRKHLEEIQKHSDWGKSWTRLSDHVYKHWTEPRKGYREDITEQELEELNITQSDLEPHWSYEIVSNDDVLSKEVVTRLIEEFNQCREEQFVYDSHLWEESNVKQNNEKELAREKAEASG